MDKNRNKHFASSQNVFCYTGEELNQYISGDISKDLRIKICHHLNVEKCERCRELFSILPGKHSVEEKIEPFFDEKRVDEIQKSIADNNSLPEFIQPKDKIAKGQIWTTSTAPKNMNGQQLETVPIGIPVLIIESGDSTKKLSNLIRVIPISFDKEFQKEGESIIISDSNPLNISILLEIFNERPMLAGNLIRFRGFLQKEDLEKVFEIRQIFKEMASPKEYGSDSQYIQWKKKEFKLAEYLSFPVNDSLWEENIEVQLKEYYKAADTDFTHKTDDLCILEETADYNFKIIQKEDQIILRFSSDDIEPMAILINGESVNFENNFPGDYEVLIGNAESLSGPIEITLKLEDESFSYGLVFV